MRLSLLVLPVAMLGLAGCIDVHEHPPAHNTTVVTPNPDPSATVVSPVPPPPAAVYTTPGTSTTVVTHP